MGEKPHSKEVRIGLVLYGGVSLAVYINGVTQEFARVVRGEGVYGLIKSLTDTDIIVDVISGTSAGGINGVTLAYALCNNRSLDAVAEMWRTDASLYKMERKPFAVDPEPPSVLDGEGYFKRKLEEAFTKLGDSEWKPDSTTPSDPSAFEELDLFVTATDCFGQERTWFDAFSSPVTIKDFRQIFWLKHRIGRKLVFGDPSMDPNERVKLHIALAAICRATSAFPAVFQPVSMDESNPYLAEWGHLGGLQTGQDGRTRWRGSGKRHFQDGGILDNHPFSYTLDAMANRMDYGTVERKLIYVDPTPDMPEGQHGDAPTFLEATWGGAFTIPHFQSIAGYLKDIAQHNGAVLQYKRVAAQVVRGGRTNPTEAAVCSWIEARQDNFMDRMLQMLVSPDGRVAPLGPKQAAVAEKLRGVAKASLVSAQFDRMDVYYGRRRLAHLTGCLGAIRSILSDTEALVLARLNQIAQAYEIVQSALETHMQLMEFPDEPSLPDLDEQFDLQKKATELWRLQEACLNRSLSVEIPPADSLRQATSVRDIKAQGTTWLKEVADALSSTLGTTSGPGTITGPDSQTVVEFLWSEADKVNQALPRRHELRRRSSRFEEIDVATFPLLYASGLQCTEEIHVWRISPYDAQRGFSRRPAEEKIAGKALNHFGGFLKDSWRANDILWGRIDAACRLIEILLPKECRMGHADPKFELAKLFPRSPVSSTTQLQEWIGEGGEPKSELIELLIESAQLEIIGEELPDVINAAVDQQSAWGQEQVARRA